MTLDEAIRHCEEVAEQNEWFDRNCLESIHCMTQIVEIKDNPFWEHDVNKAIYDFEAVYGVKPHMYIGKNFIDLVATSFEFFNETPADTTMRTMHTYRGVPCEYDPDISCVILKA